MAEEIFSLFSGLSSDFDQKYQKDPNFIQRMKCWSGFIDKYLMPGRLVYDLGCGPGVFSFFAATKGAEVTGIDGSDGMINLCREKLSAYPEKERLKIRFVREVLPLMDPVQYPQADLVICSSMFEYILEKEMMIDSFRSLLKEDGILLLSVPNRVSVYRFFEKLSYRLIGKPSYLKHVSNQFSYEELEIEFRQQHFIPLEKRYYANKYMLSGLLKLLLPERYTSNLLLVVFQKKPD